MIFRVSFSAVQLLKSSCLTVWLQQLLRRPSLLSFPVKVVLLDDIWWGPRPDKLLLLLLLLLFWWRQPARPSLSLSSAAVPTGDAFSLDMAAARAMGIRQRPLLWRYCMAMVTLDSINFITSCSKAIWSADGKKSTPWPADVENDKPLEP